MTIIDRRSALKLAAASSAAAFASTAIAQSAPAKPKQNLSPEQEHADRDRAMKAGLTDAEAECWELAGQLAGKLLDLPKLHVMDDHEISHAMHVIQMRILARPTYRRYLDISKAAAGQPSKTP